MRSQQHLAFDLSLLRNTPQSLAEAAESCVDAESEGSCQATPLMKNRARIQAMAF